MLDIINNIEKNQIEILKATVDKLQTSLEADAKDIDILKITDDELASIKKAQNTISEINSIMERIGNSIGINVKERSLDSSFTNLRIEKIIINNDIIDAKNYKTMLVSVCLYLYKYDCKKFSNMLKSDIGSYFCSEPNTQKCTRKLNLEQELYIITQLNSNSIVKLIKRMMEFYGFNLNKIKIIVS